MVWATLSLAILSTCPNQLSRLCFIYLTIFSLLIASSNSSFVLSLHSPFAFCVGPNNRPSLPQGNIPGIHFCWRLSRLKGQGLCHEIALTPIERATFRLAAQCLNQLCPLFTLWSAWKLHPLAGTKYERSESRKVTQDNTEKFFYRKIIIVFSNL
jgi:hypothetical protein